MNVSAQKFALIIALALFSCSLGSLAQTTTAKKAAPQAKVADDEDAAPDVKGSTTTEYRCEMNDALTIYTNTDDSEHIALRWKNHIHRLSRITTSTGADRFENKKAGLVWINIPSKGMLLDSKHGQQLANDCKAAGQ